MESSTQRDLDEFFVRIYRTRRNVGELKFKPGQVEAEIAALDARQAEAMRLYYVEKLKQSAIAEKMGISQPTVCNLLKKGRRALFQQLAC